MSKRFKPSHLVVRIDGPYMQEQSHLFGVKADKDIVQGDSVVG